MKCFQLIIFLLANYTIAIAQNNIGIGTQTPHASAQLDVSSTTKGLLAPRMTTAQRNAIATPAKGLLVYDTDVNGLFHYNGSAWVNFGAGGGGNGWGLTGNAGTSAATNFLGTTDKKPLLFRVNNRFHGGLDTLGNILLGDSAGGALNSSSARNIAIGTGALLRNSKAVQLIAIGDSSMAYSQSGPGLFGGSFGFYNTGVGINTLKNNAGNFNTASGAYAMEDNTGGEYNTAMGAMALGNNTFGGGNTAVGFNALANNTEGSANTAIGYIANGNNTTGQSNTSLGAYTLAGNISGSKNLAFGAEAMYNNISGTANVALGFAALHKSTNNSNLVAIGDSALYNNGLNASSPSDGIANVAIGSRSLLMNTTGYNNTAVGFSSMAQNIIGLSNTALGAWSLHGNSSGYNNAVVGVEAMAQNTLGYHNSALGAYAMLNNKTGHNNIAVGTSAMTSNNSGSRNVGLGPVVLSSNTTGSNNVAVGYVALSNSVDRSGLVAIGDSALYNNGSTVSQSFHATANTAVGSRVMKSNTSGYQNTATGSGALLANTTGYNNTGAGAFSLQSNTIGNDNTAFGRSALSFNTDGFSNTAVGSVALQNNTSGDLNTAIGLSALSINTIGNGNTGLGYNADVSANNLSNATAIGYNATVNASNKIRLGNNSVTVIEGQVAFTTSDGRFKQNIQDNAPGLDFITALKPLTYQYKSYELERFMNQQNPERQAALNRSDYTAAENMVHMGFIAQDVEKLLTEKGYNLSLVHKPTNPSDNYSIAYGELVVPLVKAVQEQQAMIVEMKQMIEQLKKELALQKK